ncbi:restriction endonuclease subunit S [Candidatus Pelagibacter bacterium]|nr:restriction endonuclease subunit S [Candidatus Pelagibacter bacterium]
MWNTVKLKEIVNLDIGKTPARDNPKYWDKNKKSSNIWVSIRDMSAISGLYIGDSREYISNEGAKLFKEVPKNTLIMSFKLSIGKLAITKVNLRTNEAIAAFEIKDETILCKEYLYYYLSSMNWDKIVGQDIKVKGKTLNKAKLKEILILLPPLTEQQRIVAELDMAFFEIDKLIKFEEIKIKKNETLIQNYVNNIFKTNKNPLKLSAYTEINPAKKEVNNLDDSTEVSFMPMKDLGINNKLAIPNQKRKLKDVRGNYTYFSEGDILLAKITPCFENGKIGIASNLLNGIGFGSSEYIVFRPNKKLKNVWLYYFLNRKTFRIDGAQNMSGAVGHKRVNKDFIENTLIPIPPIEEQEKILSTLESLFNYSKTINQITIKKIKEINFLKKSILNKLLNHKLVDAA